MAEPNNTANTSPVTVTISAIIRASPYVEKGAKDIGLPPSIPPSKVYIIKVNVSSSLKQGESIDLSIINNGSENGSAAVWPPSIQGTSMVTIRADRQTQVAPAEQDENNKTEFPTFKTVNAGNLHLQATYKGTVVAVSNGFSVCAHPNAMERTFRKDVNDDALLGLQVLVTTSSDSGVVADLDKCQASEIINYGAFNDPPFSSGSGFRNTSGYMPIVPPPPATITVDNYTVPRPRVVDRQGVFQIYQAHVFRCFRCGAVDIGIPHSGYFIEQSISKSGKGSGWLHKTKCQGTEIGVTIPETRVIVNVSAGQGHPESSVHHLAPASDGGHASFSRRQNQGFSLEPGPLGVAYT